MSYDGFYSELSTRGTANDILNQLLVLQTEVETTQDEVEVTAFDVSTTAAAVEQDRIRAEDAANEAGLSQVASAASASSSEGSANLAILNANAAEVSSASAANSASVANAAVVDAEGYAAAAAASAVEAQEAADGIIVAGERLDSIATATMSVNDILIADSPSTMTAFTTGSVGRGLLDDDSIGDAHTTLGLGSVALEDIVPVAKGGTGGTTQATARTGLGLGTVAIESTVPVAKGGTGVTTLGAALTALEGVGAYSKATILATVSQSGGVPTGGVIESGSNANGSYTKWADGTMICSRSDSYTTVAITTAFGALFRATSVISRVNWAQTFVSAPSVSHSSSSSSGGGWVVIQAVATSSLTPAYYPIEVTSGNRDFVITSTGIGRWF